MRQLSYTIWGWSKDKIPTTWGASWDYCGTADCGTADHVVITLDPSPRCIQETLIITIPPFQHSCLHESYQHLKLPYYICCYCFLVRTDDYLSSIIDSDDIRFMWGSSLIHGYRITILWRFSVVFVFDQCCYYFFPEFWVLFFSEFEWLIMWR